ncbi:hypothetical protein [Niveibacterium microcysteis]|uniref:Uncharacterized protein n=1 Tax=Niveibacterium microcysteis TaxID=2811415 RepID=A0ABX7M430_9RHOO|nr:hypothetical protein [Niveibacterium microcysteis]QSI76506.1 hypothetical protein JY500_18920 [Niveibacterium microcysteis]
MKTHSEIAPSAPIVPSLLYAAALLLVAALLPTAGNAASVCEGYRPGAAASTAQPGTIDAWLAAADTAQLRSYVRKLVGSKDEAAQREYAELVAVTETFRPGYAASAAEQAHYVAVAAPAPTSIQFASTDPAILIETAPTAAGPAYATPGIVTTSDEAQAYNGERATRWSLYQRMQRATCAM